MRLTEHCAIHHPWKAEYQKSVCVIPLSTLRYLYFIAPNPNRTPLASARRSFPDKLVFPPHALPTDATAEGPSRLLLTSMLHKNA